MKRYEIFHREGRFDLLWNRLSRSVPIIGILVSFIIRHQRLEGKEWEDTEYHNLMEISKANVSLSSYSVLREKAVIKGELFGHVIAVSIGIVSYLFFRHFRIVFSATWVLALIADWAGGIIAGRVFDRKDADCRPNF